jgi:hypothetical protein
MYEPHTVQPLTRAEFAFRLLKHGLIVSSLIGVSLLVGMAGYRYIAGLPWIDAFLNAAMLLGGMGPVDDMPTDAAKLFAGFYSLYCGVVFIASAGILVVPVAHRILHKLHLGDKR